MTLAITGASDQSAFVYLSPPTVRNQGDVFCPQQTDADHRPQGSFTLVPTGFTEGSGDREKDRLGTWGPKGGGTSHLPSHWDFIPIIH